MSSVACVFVCIFCWLWWVWLLVP